MLDEPDLRLYRGGRGLERIALHDLDRSSRHPGALSVRRHPFWGRPVCGSSGRPLVLLSSFRRAASAESSRAARGVRPATAPRCRRGAPDSAAHQRRDGKFGSVTAAGAVGVRQSGFDQVVKMVPTERGRSKYISANVVQATLDQTGRKMNRARQPRARNSQLGVRSAS